MEHYSFSDVLPENASRDYEPSLFNLLSHRVIQAPRWNSFYIINEKKSLISGEVHFTLENAVARSPHKSPFGSFEFSSSLPPRVLFEFIQFAEQNLAEKGAIDIAVKNPPQLVHQGSAALLQTFLFNLGYQVVDAEAGAIIRIEESFENKLDSFEKRKLRQGRESSLTTSQLPAEQLERAYHFIADCRAKKNYALSMTYEDLVRIQEIFNDRLVLFGVFKDAELIAASIALLVRSDVLYNFYADHDQAFDQWSPVVILIEGMYHYCKQHSIQMLDLGTSAFDGRPNFGLLDFKIHLGGIVTPKLTFRKLITR